MASQILALGTLTAQSDWAGAILIEPALVAGGATAYLREINVSGGGNVQFRVSATTTGDPADAGPELKGTWEIYAEAISFSDDEGNSLALKGPNNPDNSFSDPDEPYFWTPDNGTAVTAYWAAARTNIQLTLDTGLDLADSDDTGLDVDAKALLVASDSGTAGNFFYEDADRGGTDTPLDGEVGLGADETVVSGFRRRTATILQLNDDNSPTALDIGAYFSTGGAGNDLTLYLQTLNDGEVSFTVASAVSFSRVDQVRFTLPADGQTLLDNLADGDRWIFKLARTTPVNQDHTVDAGAVAWAFDLPQPTVTHTRAPADHAVDAAAIAWTFALPQPTVTRTGATASHTVDASAIAWVFDLPEPTVRVVGAASHAVDAGPPVRWAFAVSQPTVTLTTGLAAEQDSFSPTLDLASRIQLLLPQYDGATVLRALIGGIITIVQEEIADPLFAMNRGLNPDESSGVLLDWIGLRLGLPRPSVASSAATYFGFDGTEAAGGRTFGQAPFFTTARGIEAVEPIGDATYRILLKARARRLRGAADRESIEEVLEILFGAGNGYVDETVTPVTLRVTSENTVTWRLASTTLFELLIPRPAGREVAIVRS